VQGPKAEQGGILQDSKRAKLESLQLAPWATCRRQDLLELLDRLTPKIEPLSLAIEQEALKRPEVRRLMTHPGVGPITALAFVLIIGTPERFRCGKQLGSYLGLIPCEDSSAGKQRLGHICKQGNSLLRFLLVEAAHATVRYDPDWKRRYLHLAMRREQRIASSDGPQTRRAPLLDVAQGLGLPAIFAVRFARGEARTRPWCAVEHRAIDWAPRSLSRGREFEEVIMVEVLTGEMVGSN
jgi:Transposase IS116/IS110/IS902 family